MEYYNNILASSYKFFSRFERETPVFTAICIVTVCQFTLVFLIYTIIKMHTHVNPFIIFPNKYYAIPIVPLWIFGILFITVFLLCSEVGIQSTICDRRYYLELPIEESLFFICIPYACVFTFHCLNKAVARNEITGMRILTIPAEDILMEWNFFW